MTKENEELDPIEAPEVIIVTEEDIKTEADAGVKELELMKGQLDELQLALSNDPKFAQFMTFQKTFQDKSKEFFKRIETQMIENDVDSIPGEWGKFTIVSRKDYKVDPDVKLPAKLYKKVPDTTAIKYAIEHEGKDIKGVTVETKKHLRKTIKSPALKEDV